MLQTLSPSVVPALNILAQIIFFYTASLCFYVGGGRHHIPKGWEPQFPLSTGVMFLTLGAVAANLN